MKLYKILNVFISVYISSAVTDRKSDSNDSVIEEAIKCKRLVNQNIIATNLKYHIYVLLMNIPSEISCRV